MDPIEDVIDLVHFLATQRKLATDKNEKDVVGESKKDAGVKGDKVPGDSAVRFRHRKKGRSFRTKTKSLPRPGL